ncbi:MAG: hypothetical protein C0501_30300 [Isosphaera sp.]|nr:hypothetical protein [Isosphaera sp.]
MRAALLPAVLLAASADAQPPADKDLTARVELPLKSPRTRDPVLGGAKDKVVVSVWVPDGVKTVRGAVCNPFSKDEPPSKHWKAACRHWRFAYVGVDFDAVKKDEFPLLLTGLAELAKKTGRPELEHVPFCFTGMSRGGGMSVNLAELVPDRTLAAVPVCLEVGPTSDATRRVPMVTVFGEKDGSQMEQLLRKLPEARKLDARWGIAVQWNRKHEFGQANNLSFVFMDDVLARRLPKEPGRDKPAPLADIPLEDGWLGDIGTWGKEGRLPTVAAWKEFKGDRAAACWFPSGRTAAVWRAFVAGTKDVTVTEPAGLGDGQAFGAHTAAKPVAVKLALAATLKPTAVEVWDGDRKVAEKAAAPWEFEVKLPAGIHGLYAVVREAGQPERLSRPHTIVVAE